MPSTGGILCLRRIARRVRVGAGASLKWKTAIFSPGMPSMSSISPPTTIDMERIKHNCAVWMVCDFQSLSHACSTWLIPSTETEEFHGGFNAEFTVRAQGVRGSSHRPNWRSANLAEVGLR